MSKEKQKSLFKKELKELFDSLPEVSKEYLLENFREMSFETFKAYFKGFMHGREQVLEIVKEHIRKEDEILHT